jgi:hypothetical protein
MLIQLCFQQVSKLTEKETSALLYVQCFSVLEDSFIFPLVPRGLELQRIRIDVAFPEPLCGAKLGILWIKCRDLRQGVVEGPPGWAIVYTERDVGESVSYTTGIFGGNGVKAEGVLFRGPEEMPVAALHSEAVRQCGKAINDVHNRRVNSTQIQCRQSVVTVSRVAWVLYKLPRLCECLQRISTPVWGSQCVIRFISSVLHNYTTISRIYK